MASRRRTRARATASAASSAHRQLEKTRSCSGRLVRARSTVSSWCGGRARRGPRRRPSTARLRRPVRRRRRHPGSTVDFSVQTPRPAQPLRVRVVRRRSAGRRGRGAMRLNTSALAPWKPRRSGGATPIRRRRRVQRSRGRPAGRAAELDALDATGSMDDSSTGARRISASDGAAARGRLSTSCSRVLGPERSGAESVPGPWPSADRGPWTRGRNEGRKNR